MVARSISLLYQVILVFVSNINYTIICGETYSFFNIPEQMTKCNLVCINVKVTKQLRRGVLITINIKSICMTSLKKGPNNCQCKEYLHVMMGESLIPKCERYLQVIMIEKGLDSCICKGVHNIYPGNRSDKIPVKGVTYS